MKLKNLLSLLIASLLLTGCSSVYTTEYFGSKEKFYNDFNETVIDKNIKITLTDDSLYKCIGAIVENDTLYSLGYLVTNQYMKLPVSEIKRVEYNKYIDKSGTVVLLRDGRKLDAAKINYSGDSLDFFADYKVTDRIYIASVKKVKEVRYNDKWGHIGTKILAGTVTGIVTGFAIGTKVDDHAYYQEQGEYTFTGCLFGASAGAIVGFVVGLWTGYNYIYKFN